jgi:transcriptional regulator GlxA family with amidase domain
LPLDSGHPRRKGWIARSRRWFGSICTGALVFAKAGLLEGRRAITHRNWCGELAQNYPGVTVDPDPIYVKDGNCCTSAGVTAGIDRTLALAEGDLGSGLAVRIARMMVVFLGRHGRPEPVQRNARSSEPGPSILRRSFGMDCGQHEP